MRTERDFNRQTARGIIVGLAQGAIFVIPAVWLILTYRETIAVWIETIFGPLPRP